MEAVVFYLVKVWQELGSSFLCLQCTHQRIRVPSTTSEPDAVTSLQSSLADRGRICEVWLASPIQVHFGSVEPFCAHTWRMPTATWSMEVHANPTSTYSVPSTDCPLATLLCGTDVAHLMPDPKRCCYLSGKCSSGTWSTDLRDITAAFQPLPCNIVLTLMKSLWCRSMYWKISVSNAEEDEEDIPSLKGSSRVRWTVSES